MTPVTYIPAWIAADLFARLWHELPWERRDGAPRRECWMNDFMRAYTYGRGAGVRTYEPVVWHPLAKVMQAWIKRETGHTLEGCFSNGYDGPRDHLGWHADDSPEIDPQRPIAVVSFGSPRAIWFRENGSTTHDTMTLGPGSLLLMHAGMQQTHQHRIPKHSADCGPRLSLTFRGLQEQ